MKKTSEMIALSMGDPSGVGPEIVVKALGALKGKAHGSVVVVGNRALLEHKKTRDRLWEGVTKLEPSS